ncbi:MAG: lectin like domain-containing protein [Candidatus Omnitrophota bacterium]
MKKAITCITFIISIFFVFLFQPSLFSGSIPDKPKAASLNPTFLKYQEAVKAGTYQAVSSSGHPLGYIPVPVDLSHLKGVIDPSVVMPYPETYDLRNQGKLTSVKNQGSCGSCWAFASMAALESYLMPLENRDFSEQDLNAHHGFDGAECAGGNTAMAAAYFLRWAGPLNESDVPYPYTSEGSQFSSQKHVQQLVYLPNRTSPLDNDTLKYFITNYGAVQCALQLQDPEFYNKQSYSSYYNGEAKTNHGVVLVGWDDNFPTSKFKIAPPGKGAFIAKNSWGQRWGQSGYFYISYYDTSLGGFNIFNAESTSNYSKIYQYDSLGWTCTYGWGNKTAWGANIFTAEEFSQLKAVGFYLTDANAKYMIYIYKNVIPGQPRNGTLAATQRGFQAYPGFYTIPLNYPVNLVSGEKFSVVIKFINSSNIYPLATEYPIDKYSSKATAHEGESFISYSGDTWGDLAAESANVNACIKAYTGADSSGGSPTITLSQKTLDFSVVFGENATESQDINISNNGTGTLNWTITKSGHSDWFSYTPSSGSNSGIITISVSPSGKSVGTYTGFLTINGTDCTNSPQIITINLRVMSSSESKAPFGDFSTPLDLSTVMGSVPVTGWALDDEGIDKVKIYIDNIYIGDAIFLEGARPDVQAAFPNYPNANKAGWGYMLLTNFLPNGGNGVYTIYAEAIDKEGHTTTLGSKTIYCHNKDAIKPFGALDTPPQGGAASGKEFVNFGWVLSPYPGYIPIDGSTIHVYVDSVSLGNVHYNNYRSDISGIFPECYNKDGAGGYFYLNTTNYTNGIHTIQWIASDDYGESDGIGSRYFTIQNASSRLSETPTYSSLNELADIPVDQTETIQFKKGHPETDSVTSKPAEPDEAENASLISIREDERLEINLKEDGNTNDAHVSGYHLIGNRLETLPIGSTLDRQNGIFYWQPSAGFVGNYRLIFVTFDASGPIFQKKVHVKIIPKY